MFYSATTKGFYLPAIHGDAIPSDAVEITDEAHRLLTEGQSSGMVISTDANGVPVLVAPAPVIRPIASPPAPPTVIEQLAKLDADNALTQRNLRETIMLMNEAFKLVSNNAVDLSAIPGVAKVYAVEAEAAVLRAQL